VVIVANENEAPSEHPANPSAGRNLQLTPLREKRSDAQTIGDAFRFRGNGSARGAKAAQLSGGSV
jgi:hypothetical protein